MSSIFRMQRMNNPPEKYYRVLLGSRKDDPESISEDNSQETCFVRKWDGHRRKWSIIQVFHRGIDHSDVNTAMIIQLDNASNWVIISHSTDLYDEHRDNPDLV